MRVSPPRGTEFTKTYAYRAMCKFAKRMEELDLSDDSVKMLIDSVIRYGKQQKLLTSKGTNILNMQAIIDICVKDLQNRDTATADLMNSIRQAHNYLTANGINDAASLIGSAALGGMPRIQLLLKSGKLPTPYLAVSRVAAEALDHIDRGVLPSDQTLLRLRARLVLNAETRRELRTILGPDLNTAGMPRSVTC